MVQVWLSNPSTYSPAWFAELTRSVALDTCGPSGREGLASTSTWLDKRPATELRCNSDSVAKCWCEWLMTSASTSFMSWSFELPTLAANLTNSSTLPVQ